MQFVTVSLYKEDRNNIHMLDDFNGLILNMKFTLEKDENN